MSLSTFSINNRKIGPGYPAYIIAEISANHQQDYEVAARLVKEAAATGVDAIKLQTYRPDTLTIDCDNAHFQINKGTLWDGRTLYDLYSEAYMPWDWQPRLKQLCDELDVDCFSSPFDASSVDFLEQMNVPAYKVASFEVVDIPLLEKIGQTGKPVIMSTGMATLEEVSDAVDALKRSGTQELCLLKCTSAYPAEPSSMNLRSIPYLSEKFQVPAGLSDHTLGISVPVASVALGACVIEKHITFSREIEGPDSAFSLEVHEFKELVDAVRVTEQALGEVQFGVGAQEQKNRGFRRSLFIVEDVQQGEILTMENVRSIRPGNGLPPKHFQEVLGQQVTESLPKGTPLEWRHIA